jgi:predicted AlkP superfamily pyrophosphatase or phosphodiesterase
MKSKTTLILTFLIMFLMINTADASRTSTSAAKTNATESGKPKLVVQITIDQLRGDMPMRFKDRLGDGGFKYLMDKGTHYINAHFQHADTETPIGHAALFTGTYPAHNGIVAGNWFDKDKGRIIYNIEDDRYPIIGMEPEKGKGRSPANLLSSTIGDELILSNNGQSRMFSVSVKDRGAVIPGGHTGKAFWFSKRIGTFESSTYYYKNYPGWVKEWNNKKLSDKYKGTSWELLKNISTYVFGGMDDRPYEQDYFGMGRTFPHPFPSDSPYFYAALSLTPPGDELVLDFAKTLIEQEKLGKGAATDFLAVSFSSTDYIGHLWGPSSLEAEDNILRVDRNLADLFNFIDKHVGLDQTLIILAADHGMCEAPEFMRSLGFEVGRLTSETIAKGTVKEAVKARLGTDIEVIRMYEHPYVYLDEEAVAKSGHSIEEVERVVAEETVKIPGIHSAVTRTDLIQGTFAPTLLNKKILNNFHPKRSGSVHVIAEQFWYFAYEMDDVTELTAIHASPWKYDTYVPLFFAGHGIPAQRIARAVTPYDIAATLAVYLEIKPPSGSMGKPLTEVLKGH